MVTQRRSPLELLAILVALSLVPAAVAAQVLYGSIVGQVRDTSGAAVPGVTVTITGLDTGLTRTAVSNDTGGYSFTNVLAGQYDVKASLQGFKEFVKSGVPVTVNEVSRVDVSLELGTLTDTVTVQSEAQLLQTDKADTHTEIRSAAITTLPLSQNRNYQTLINLVPGATPGSMQNSEVDTPGRALSTNVNGLDRNNNGTRTDGATNVNIWLPHHTMLVSPAETVDTVNVSTSNFDAEQGMAGGAAITVVTKSGTNNFKGSAFAFYNNASLNATPLFCDREGGRERPHRRCDAGRPDLEKPTLLLRRLGGSGTRRHRSSSSITFRHPRCASATSARRSTPTDRSRSSTTRVRGIPTGPVACRSPATSSRRT